jgi:hypothetical protein
MLRTLPGRMVTCCAAVRKAIVQAAAAVQHAQQVGVRSRLLHAAPGFGAAATAAVAAGGAVAAADHVLPLGAGCHAVNLHRTRNVVWKDNRATICVLPDSRVGVHWGPAGWQDTDAALERCRHSSAAPISCQNPTGCIICMQDGVQVSIRSSTYTHHHALLCEGDLIRRRPLRS